MTMRSKQWYTNTSRLPNSFVNVSIGRPPLIQSRQQDHRSDGRWSQNFKYVWLVLLCLCSPGCRCLTGDLASALAAQFLGTRTTTHLTTLTGYILAFLRAEACCSCLPSNLACLAGQLRARK